MPPDRSWIAHGLLRLELELGVIVEGFDVVPRFREPRVVVVGGGGVMAGVVPVLAHALPIVGCAVEVTTSFRVSGEVCTSFKHSSLMVTPFGGVARSVNVTRCCRLRGHAPITPGEKVS